MNLDLTLGVPRRDRGTGDDRAGRRRRAGGADRAGGGRPRRRSRWPALSNDGQAGRARLGQALPLARRPRPRGQRDARARRAQLLLLGRSGRGRAGRSPTKARCSTATGRSRRRSSARSTRTSARSGTPISSPNMDEEDADEIFHPAGVSSGRIPMFVTRIANMREVGRVLLRASTTAGSARRSRRPGAAPPRSCSAWCSDFPSFDDTTTYDGRRCASTSGRRSSPPTSTARSTAVAGATCATSTS